MNESSHLSLRQWAGYGLLLGGAIATLEFCYYVPRYELGLPAYVSLLLVWGGEGVLFALVIAAFERRGRGDLRAGGLVLAVVAGVAISVLVWQQFVFTVLRDGLGVRLFFDYVGQPVVWTGVVLYHGWLLGFFGGLAAAVHAAQRRRTRMLNHLAEAELGRARVQRRLAEASLASLNARVDAEYLSGTLSRVERLYETDPRAADQLLDELVAYLRSALADLRASHHALTSRNPG